MKTWLTGLFMALMWISVTCQTQAQVRKSNPFQKVRPLPVMLHPLPLHSVKPLGWLEREVRKNLNGFTGQLEQLAPDLLVEDQLYGKQRLSKQTPIKNLGALGEAGDWQVQYLWWNSETQSNWLDGWLRSAILLDDTTSLSKAEHLVARFLESQDEDGYLGIYDRALRYQFDNENGELWAKTTLLRALLGWYDYQKSPKLLRAIEQAVANVMNAYPMGRSQPFKSTNPNAGGLTHGLAFTDVLEQLHAITGKEVYLDYALFLYEDFSRQTLNEDAQWSKLMNIKLPLHGHGVHTYEHLRSVAAAYYASGNPLLGQALNLFLKKIEKTLAPSGGPISDEFIKGRQGHPDIGYEFCALHELMAGWISLLAKTGKPQYADRAEHLLFNAVLGNTHPTESSICYLKQDNAWVLQGGNNGDTTDHHQTRYRYSPLHREAAVCCVPNAGRIFPYYIQNMWMKSTNGFTASLLGPCELQAMFEGAKVMIRQEADFPFDNRLRFSISSSLPKTFELRIRKPDWAKTFHSSIPCTEHNGYLVFRRLWGSATDFTLTFSSELKAKTTGQQERYFQSGPWVLCHALEAMPVVTRTWEKSNLREMAYFPVKKVKYRYNGGRLLEENKQLHHFKAPLVHPETGRTDVVLLQPMARTILRQVSFPLRSSQ